MQIEVRSFFCRYHNHLHASIVTAEWTPQEEQILFKEHAKVGNKWSAIAQALPGRSDNCVKNHFYSKLRKSLRRLNKIIQDVLKKHLPIRGAVLSRIMKTAESKFKNESKVDEELAEFCDSNKSNMQASKIGSLAMSSPRRITATSILQRRS